MFPLPGNQLLGRRPCVETMPEISITKEQHEQLEEVRADVEDAFVDDYGYIPTQDAVKYLLDTYTPPEERDAPANYEQLATAEYPQLQAVASEVPDVPGSGIDADEMRGRLLAELGTEEFAAKLDDVADGENPGQTPETTGSDNGVSDATPDSTTEETTDATPTDAAGGQAASNGDRSPSGVSTSDTETTDASSGDGASADTPGGGDPLATVNRMLDKHDQKWRKSGGDEPYEVDLPDGRTESVRTRDDVRQLLFRHY